MRKQSCSVRGQDETSELTTAWAIASNADLVVRLEGDLALGCCDAFRREFQERAAHGRQPLVIDLTAVHFIDSAGIGELVTLYKQHRGSREVCLIVPNGPVRVTLDRMQLTRLLPVFPTLAAAQRRARANSDEEPSEE